MRPGLYDLDGYFGWFRGGDVCGFSRSKLSGNGFAHRNGGGPADPWVSLSFRKYVDVPPGASYQAQKVVWAFDGGDWHLSAHRYRTWFDAHVQQMEHPGDLGQELVLSPHYNFRRFEGIRYRFEDIPEMAERDRKEFESRHFS